MVFHIQVKVVWLTVKVMNALSTAGLKEFRFIMQSVDGRTISFREVGHLSASVSCPLVSFGRLFKNGWRIGGNTNDPLLEHPDSGVAVAMSFRNESFVVPGFIRQLAQVNAVSIKLPEAWKALNPGWHSTSKGLPLCRSNGTRYIDASKRYSPSEFPFRTTICLRDSGWEMVEHCARYVNKDPAMLKPLEARAARRNWFISSFIKFFFFTFNSGVESCFQRTFTTSAH